MDYRTELVNMINRFNVESVEEFKEAEMLILKDSKFRSIRKKKDYGGHVTMLKKVKGKALRIDPKTVAIPESDKEALQLRKAFEHCLVTFSAVCDSYVQMQLALKEKAEGADISYGQYKEIHNKIRSARAKLNEDMHEMDILYSDFAQFSQADDSEDLGGVAYKTYDQL